MEGDNCRELLVYARDANWSEHWTTQLQCSLYSRPVHRWYSLAFTDSHSVPVQCCA